MFNGDQETFTPGKTALMVVLIVVVLIVAYFVRKNIRRAQYGDEYIRMGIAKERKQQYEEAVNYYMAAESAYRESGSDEGRARAYYLAGMLESKCEDHEEAMKYYHQAEPIARVASQPEDLAFLLMNMGGTEEELCNMEEARKYYMDAMEVYEKLGDREGVLFAWDKLNLEMDKSNSERKEESNDVEETE